MTEVNSKKWVLVADGGMAKLLSSYEESFQLIEQLQSPYQHTPSKDLATDKDGNFYSGKHHSKGNSADLHDQAETDFITELSKLLEKKFYAGKFNQLTLIMPPKALGKMRQCLNKNIRHVVNQEISKDLSTLPVNELLMKLAHIL
jgi:protein required for attachment to host cells